MADSDVYDFEAIRERMLALHHPSPPTPGQMGSMQRRDFLKFLALLATPAAVKPEQIAAFEHYYDLNSPKEMPLIALDEIFVSGLAAKSTRVKIDIFRGTDLILPFGLNAFGGITRWVATPDQKIIATPSDLRWNIDFLDDGSMKEITGYISYIDGTGLRLSRALLYPAGSLS